MLVHQLLKERIIGVENADRAQALHERLAQGSVPVYVNNFISACKESGAVWKPLGASQTTRLPLQQSDTAANSDEKAFEPAPRNKPGFKYAQRPDDSVPPVQQHEEKQVAGPVTYSDLEAPLHVRLVFDKEYA